MLPMEVDTVLLVSSSAWSFLRSRATAFKTGGGGDVCVRGGGAEDLLTGGGTSAAFKDEVADGTGVVLMPLSSPFGGAPIGAFLISPTGRGPDMELLAIAGQRASKDAQKWTTTNRGTSLLSQKPL